MEKNDQTKAAPHDHDNHLPKDVLNLEQDPKSFKDPLEQQLEKQDDKQKISNAKTDDKGLSE